MVQIPPNPYFFALIQVNISAILILKYEIAMKVQRNFFYQIEENSS